MRIHKFRILVIGVRTSDREHVRLITAAACLSRLVLQGNCQGPPTEEQAEQMNLPDSAVASLQAVRTGQCLILINKRGFLAEGFNKWIDNLHIAFVSDTMQAETAVGISVVKSNLIPGAGSNVFVTRTTFHAMEGLKVAQAFAITPTQLELRRGSPGLPVIWGNAHHAVLLEGVRLFPARFSTAKSCVIEVVGDGAMNFGSGETSISSCHCMVSIMLALEYILRSTATFDQVMNDKTRPDCFSHNI